MGNTFATSVSRQVQEFLFVSHSLCRLRGSNSLSSVLLLLLVDTWVNLLQIEKFYGESVSTYETLKMVMVYSSKQDLSIVFSSSHSQLPTS